MYALFEVQLPLIKIFLRVYVMLFFLALASSCSAYTAVISGDTVVYDEVIENGRQDVYDNAKTVGSVLGKEVGSGVGAIQELHNNAKSEKTTLYNGGTQGLYDDASAFDTVIKKGSQQLYGQSKSVSSDVTGGWQGAHGNAHIENAWVHLPSDDVNGTGFVVQELYDNATSKNVLVTNFGTQDVNGHAVATGTIIKDCAYYNPATGKMKIKNGQTLSQYGSAIDTIVGNYGQQVMGDYSKSYNTVVQKGGYQYVMDNSVSDGTTLDGGYQVVREEATAKNTVVNNGGVQSLIASSKAIGTIVNEGSMFAKANVSADATVVNSKGTLSVSGLAQMHNTTVEGGRVWVMGDSSMTGTNINSGNVFLEDNSKLTNTDLRAGLLGIISASAVVDKMRMSGGVVAFDDAINNFTFKGKSVLNGGTVDFSKEDYAGVYRTIAFDSVSGSGTIFAMGTDFSGGKGDKLNISESDGGTQYIKISDTSLTSGIPNGKGKLLLASDLSGKINFEGSDLYRGGLWLYRPELISENSAATGLDWYLSAIHKIVTPDTSVLAATDETKYSSWVKASGSLRKRLGELSYRNALHGLWADIYGGRIDGSGLKNDYVSYQLGYDVFLGSVQQEGNVGWTVGAAVEYTSGSVGYQGGSGDNDIAAVSLYASKHSSGGENIDLVLKHGQIKGRVETNVYNIDRGDYKTYGTMFSAEYNKKIAFQEGYFAEPQVQLSVGRIASDSYTTATGITVNSDAIDTVVGRVGIAVGREFDKGNVYLKASMLHEFAGDGMVRIAAANGDNFSAADSYGGTWYEVGIGGNLKLNSASSLYFDFERGFGGNVDKSWQLNMGVNWIF